MFCEKCGSRLEAGDQFCPMCGNKVAAASGALPGYAKKVSTEASDIINRLILSSMGFFILAWTFFPFVNIDTGAIGRIAGAVFGRNVGRIGVNLYGTKAAVFSLCGLLDAERSKSFSHLNTVITIAIITVLIVAVLAMLSGLVNSKGFIMVSGIASLICLFMWIAYVVYISSFIGQINSYLGDHASIKGFYGTGLILMMITLAAHAFLAIRKSGKM